MGDRAMAEIKTQGGSLYFYTHWHGQELPDYARAALTAAAPRRGDHPYALRRAVDELIRLTNSRDRETGTGLLLAPTAEDEYNGNAPSVVIDLHAWTVTALGRHQGSA